MPEKAAELRRKLADWRRQVNARMPTPNPNYEPPTGPKTAALARPLPPAEAGATFEE
jgi:hypothetical protein